MNFKKISIICLALLMVIVIGLGQVSAEDTDIDDTDIITSADDSVSVDNLNQAEIENSEISSDDVQTTLTSVDEQPVLDSSEDEILADYTPDANGIYVATTGDDDAGTGAYDSPYATISKAISSASAGKTIYIAGGTYYIDSSLAINKNLNLAGYDGTQPIIDAQNKCAVLSLGQTSAFEVSFTNITFTHGKATNGGVLQIGDLDQKAPYTYFKGKAYFTNCSFIENTATTNGGVFHQQYAATMDQNVYATSCIFIGNSAKAGSVFWGSGMDIVTFNYCVFIDNTNTVFYTNNGNFNEIKFNYWGTNSPTSSIVDSGNVDVTNDLKITLVSDVDEITTGESATFTVKFVTQSGADLGTNVYLPETPVTFTVTSGSLSRTSTLIVDKKGTTVFTPSADGEITVTATVGSQTVSKTINVVPLPLYVSATALDGEGDGSVENPYSMQDAIDVVNNGGSSKIEMLEGNYTFDSAFAVANDVSIRPYKTGQVNIVAKSGLLNIMADKQVDIFNLTVSGLSTQSTPVFVMAANSKLNILSSTIKDNKVVAGSAVIAKLASGAELNIEYSQIYNNTGSFRVQDSYGYLFDNEGGITANNNWWGLNAGPSAYSLLSLNNAPVVSSWLTITQSQDKNLLRTEWSSIITTKLVKNDGSAVDGYVQNLIGTYATDSGSLIDETFILSQENSYTETTTISGVTDKANVTTTVNDEKLTAAFDYEVPLTEIYVSVDGSDAGDGSLTSPFKTIPKALTVAKEGGATIYLINGNYNGATLIGGIPGYFNPISIDNRNVTITSYGGLVVIDRSQYYGLFVFGSNTVTEISNITFNGGHDPYANRQAISSSGNLTVRDCLFTNGTGGGFGEYIVISGNGVGYIYDSNFTETKVSYIEGHRYSNAAVFVTGVDAKAYIDNCRFENNGYVGSAYGGSDSGIAVYNAHGGEAAFRVMQGQIAATNCYFGNNSGVSMVYSYGLINYTDCVIRDSFNLPALEISSAGRGYVVDNCTFINNTKGAIGIGLSQFMKDNDVIVKNSRFINNTADKGAAIRLDKAGALIENCYFEGNEAVDGGAIYNYYADLLISHCEFVNNTASGKGGSIYTEGDQDFIEIEGNLFTNSKADIGGVIYSNGITTLFNNEMHNGIANNGSYIYNANRIGNTYIKILDNKTVDARVGVPITINATITDDMANPISGGEIIFIIEGNEYKVESVEGNASYTYTFNEENTYYVDGNYTGNRRYITVAGGATINVTKTPAELKANEIAVKLGESAVYTVNLVDDEGNPIAGKSIAVKFNNQNYTITTGADGVASLELPVAGLTSGKYDVVAVFEDDFYNCEDLTSELYIKGDSTIKVTEINGLKLTAVLYGFNGNPISNAVVAYSLNGGSSINITTNDKGEFTFDVTNDCVVNMVFEGNNSYNPSDASITLKNIAPTPKGTTIAVDKTFTRTAVDFPAGEKGYMFYFTLKDTDGNALANKEAKIGVSGKIYTVKTDKNGKAGLMINLANANVYTYAISFLGDEDYKASFAVSKLTVVKKAVTITPAKTSYTFKSAAKSKVITATLKSTNKFIPAGKKVTLTVGGKTYSAVVAKNGKISLNIAKLTKKGTYKVTIKYAGDGTYKAAASKTITVKIA